MGKVRSSGSMVRGSSASSRRARSKRDVSQMTMPKRLMTDSSQLEQASLREKERYKSTSSIKQASSEMGCSMAWENLEMEVIDGKAETSTRANYTELVAVKNQQWESTKASVDMGSHMVKVFYKSSTEICIMANSRMENPWVKGDWIS